MGRPAAIGGWLVESDAVYFSRRANEERIAAMSAPHPTARHAHLEMADRYDELASAIGQREAQLEPEFIGAA